MRSSENEKHFFGPNGTSSNLVWSTMPSQNPKIDFVELKKDTFARLQAVSEVRTIYAETLDAVKYASTPDELVASIDIAVSLNGVSGELKSDLLLVKSFLEALEPYS